MPLTNSPVSLVRTLKGAPLACLFILLLSADALRAGELCQATGYSPNSITAALRLLSNLNLVEKTPDGWRVPAALRISLLHQDAIPDHFANRASSASIRESNPSGGEDINSESFIVFPPPLSTASQIVSLAPNPTLASTHDNPPAFPSRGQQIAANGQPSTFTPERLSRDANHQQVARILDATRILFGERVHGPPARYPDVRLLLAAIAEAYVRRSSLHKPARVAYANLKRGVDPGAEFLADPLAYLPDNFLAAVGLAPLPPNEYSQTSDESAVELDEPVDPLPEVHPSLALPADVQALRSAEQVWQIAFETLRSELSRSVFRSYLETCCLASYDPATAIFSISVPAEQTRLWLQDRLSARLSHLLTGICDRRSSVHFVVVS